MSPAVFLYSGSDLILHYLPSNSNSAGKVICGTGRSDLSTVSESRKLNFGTLPKTLFFLLFSVYRTILAVAPLFRSRYPFFLYRRLFSEDPLRFEFLVRKPSLVFNCAPKTLVVVLELLFPFFFRLMCRKKKLFSVSLTLVLT